MTPQEFAALLNGRQYRKEITKQEASQAKALGIVVVYGYSDDNVELEGAVSEEVSAYEGTTLRMTRLGLLPDWDRLVENENDEAVYEDYFRKKDAGFKEIEAVWAPKDLNASWAFRTEIPHATFDVMEGDELFCRGIVFSLSAV